jgi:electron transfer flavoprotein alpha subunit
MAVVVYIESQDGVIKKAGLEVASYGRSIADDQGLKLIGVGFNIKDVQVLELYGLDKLYNIDSQGDSYFDVERYSSNISSIVDKENTSIVIVSASADGRYLGPILSAKIDAAYISNVVELPSKYEPLSVKRSCFTNKAFNETQSEKKTYCDFFIFEFFRVKRKIRDYGSFK